MKVLEVSLGKANFIVNGKEVTPEELSRDDLLKIMNDMYEESSLEDIKIPDDVELDTIRNPIEKEIVRQIIQKISDFKNNIGNIRIEVETQFPEMDK